MRRNSTIRVLAAAAAAGCLCVFARTPLAASDAITMRIGFIDTNKVIENSTPIKSRIDDAEKKMRPLEDQLNDKYKQMQKLETESKSATVLSAERRSQLDEQKSKLTGQISELSAKINSEMNRAYAEMSEAMKVAIENAIEQVARERQFTVVLNADTVAYMDKALVGACDITPGVIERLNANATAAKASSSSPPAPSIAKEQSAPKPQTPPKSEPTAKSAAKTDK